MIATVVMQFPNPEALVTLTEVDDIWTEAFPGEEAAPPETEQETEHQRAFRIWRSEFTTETRNAVMKLHTNLGHPLPSTLAKMLSDAGGSEDMIRCATRYPCPTCHRHGALRLRRPASVPRTRQFNDTLLVDVHFWDFRGERVLVYSMIDEATRFHVAEVVIRQGAMDLFEAIMRGWIRWAGSPKFVLVDPHRAQISRVFVDHMGMQGTTVLAGAAEAHWTRGLVERHGDYLREMVAKMELDGLPADISVQCVIDRAVCS